MLFRSRLALPRLALSVPILFGLALGAHAASVEDVLKQPWIQAESANFRIVTEQKEELARRMLVDLENLRYISNRVRNAQTLEGPPLTVVAMGQRSFGKLDLPEGILGVFSVSREGYGALAEVDRYGSRSEETTLARSTLLHEYHHFLLHLSTDTLAYPKWYDEGMAEYWSSLTIRDGFAWFGHPVENSNREEWLEGRGGDISFDTRELFNTTRLKFDSSIPSRTEVGRFYAQARYAVHYFNSTPELRARLAHYLRLYNAGFSQDQCVQLAFKRSYAELDKDMRQYVTRRLTARGFGIGKDGLDLPQVEIKVAKLDRAATLAVLADLLPRFTPSSSKVDEQLFEANLKANPDNPDAHAAMFLHSSGDERARLAKLAERFPTHPRLLALRAGQLSEGAYARRETGASENTWMPALEEARRQYRAAIKADPHNFLAYYGLGKLYAALPDSGHNEEGIVALDSALVYEPGAHMFHALAHLYLRGGHTAMAVKSMRSAVAFGNRMQDDRPLDALLMENLELLLEATGGTATPTGLSFKSGARYEGPVHNGRAEGTGKWLRPNGSYYEGAFAAGLPSGQGKLVSERGVAYEGQFAAGIARGKGRISFPATGKMVSYEGGVDYGTPSGNGVLVTKDGKLQASFLKGQAHGNGAFTPSGKGEAIKGAWLFGAHVWPAVDNIVYTGGIDANGRRHGNGWCHPAGAAGPIEVCRFEDGKKVPAN